MRVCLITIWSLVCFNDATLLFAKAQKLLIDTSLGTVLDKLYYLLLVLYGTRIVFEVAIHCLLDDVCMLAAWSMLSLVSDSEVGIISFSPFYGSNFVG